MGWRTIVVNTHSKLSYKNNHLVYKSAYSTEMIHLSEIDSIILETTNISVTSMLVKRLIDEKILFIFCDDKGLPQSMIEPLYGKYDASLQVKNQIAWKDSQKIRVSLEIIKQKLFNQSQFLKQLDYIDKSERILDLKNELQPLDLNNREAHAARIYFNTIFGNDFTRKTDNDVNAGLNYGYSLLLAMFSREIVLNGCITQLGLLHKSQFNYYNFASDLMEPFRILIDQIVFDNREYPFNYIKRELLEIFNTKFKYSEKSMYLTNIVSDYTKKIIQFLNGEYNLIPEFRI